MIDQQTEKVIGQFINSDFGKSGSISGANTSTIKVKFVGNSLIITYTTVFTHDKTRPEIMNIQIRSLQDEAAKAITQYISAMKNDCKQNLGRALRIKETDRRSDVEMASYNSMSTKATSYFRYFVTLEIE